MVPFPERISSGRLEQVVPLTGWQSPARPTPTTPLLKMEPQLFALTGPFFKWPIHHPWLKTDNTDYSWTIHLGSVGWYSTQPRPQRAPPTCQSTASPSRSASTCTRTVLREAPALRSPWTGDSASIMFNSHVPHPLDSVIYFFSGILFMNRFYCWNHIGDGYVWPYVLVVELSGGIIAN